MAKHPVTRTVRAESKALEFLDGVTLNRAMPLREQIYALVRRAIVTGQLGPGAVVNEIEIAERLGLSRTPVRDAVRKVADEGLVDVLAQSGTFVADIIPAQVEEAYVVRIALECQSVSRAAPLMSEFHRQNLEDIIALHSAALDRGRYSEAIARDDDFHRYIAQISGLTMLWRVVDTCKAQMDRCRILTVPNPGHGRETIEQHRAIVDALVTRRSQSAIKAMREHLQTSHQNSLQYLAGRDEAARA